MKGGGKSIPNRANDTSVSCHGFWDNASESHQGRHTQMLTVDLKDRINQTPSSCPHYYVSARVIERKLVCSVCVAFGGHLSVCRLLLQIRLGWKHFEGLTQETLALIQRD